MGWRRDLITAAAAIVRGKTVVVVVSAKEDVGLFYNLLRRTLMERKAAHSLPSSNEIYSEFCGSVKVVATGKRKRKVDIVIEVEPLPAIIREACADLQGILDMQYTVDRRWPPWHA